MIPPSQRHSGAVAWMAHNPIAANLLMLLVMVAGFYAIAGMHKEVFPSFPPETLTIVVPYPGSSPAEVEEGVVVKIEEAIQDVEGIKEIESTASEGSGVVRVQIHPGMDIHDVLSKVKSRVDGISAFPAEAERPIIEAAQNNTRLLNLTIYGPVNAVQLKQLGDTIREELLRLPGISQVNINAEREYEITLEFSDQALRQYGLRLDNVVSTIRQRSRDLPGGKIRTSDQTITLRSTGQAYTGADFEKIILLSRADGTLVRVGDVARVVDGFEEQPMLVEHNGLPAITLQVEQRGKEDALKASAAVERYVAGRIAGLPEGISLEIWSDRTAVLKSRISLLLRNALQGAILVALVLALFLRPQVAFWVVAGVPFCFLGAFAVMAMPGVDLSINVISLFGFILVLGIVVDDAIVTAESAYYTLHKENDGINSIIKGVNAVTVATVFGVLTTVLAFIPMMFMTEGVARFFSTISAVVILCLLFSIVETKFILPAHLARMQVRSPDDYTNPLLVAFLRVQDRFSQGVVSFAHNTYGNFLQRCLDYRYISLAAFVAFLLVASQLLPSGLVRFIFFPNIPSDFITVEIQMPQGTPASKTHEYAMRIRDAGLLLNARYRAATGIDIDVIENMALVSTDDTTAEIRATLLPSTERDITSVEMAKWWRTDLGDLPGLKSISFDANAGHASIPVDIRFTGADLATLRQVAEETKAVLRNYDGVFDVRDTFESGAPEADIRITPQGESLGLGQAELARQIRQAFFGAEVQRVQRGRHEVRVYARFPGYQRDTLDQLRNMWVRLPDGNEVPFSVVGEIVRQSGVSKIQRIDRMRVVNVQADVDKARVEPGEVLAAVEADALKAIIARHPGISYRFAGEAEEQQENQGTLLFSTLLVLLLIYAALAIPLKSLIQPLVIMSIIPFAIQGAVIGHLIMGMEISVISIIGMVALAGIAVNDSLVLMDYINQKTRDGMEWHAAVASAGVRRFRAVILTSLTTFVGLLPIQMETSIQAQFLKPMAISVAFGVLFSTVVTLILVPVLCFIGDDIRNRAKAWWNH